MDSSITSCETETGNKQFSQVSQHNAQQHSSPPEHMEHVLKQNSAGPLHIHCITNFITNTHIIVYIWCFPLQSLISS